MPWKETNAVSERLRFVMRLQDGERMSDLCREFGISRKTGHKLRKRFELTGAGGLTDLPRAPLHIPHKTPAEVEKLIVQVRREHPTWGPRKLKAVLERRGIPMPAASTIGEVLYRHGMVEPRRVRSRVARMPSRLGRAQAPNDVWCTDYKGHFRLGNGSYCYPLTVTDLHSRMLLACDAMDCINVEDVCGSFHELFSQRGVPRAIRSDNGVPFASWQSPGGLTKLSVMWVRLGIQLQRIRPGHPEENGQHERMHRTLKKETTRPAGRNVLQQQERFDAFVEEFNHHRPHEALGQETPASVYTPATRSLTEAVREPSYPFHDDVLKVSRVGTITLCGRSYVIGRALSSELVGVREEDDGRWLVTFFNLDLGHIDRRRKVFLHRRFD